MRKQIQADDRNSNITDSASSQSTSSLEASTVGTVCNGGSFAFIVQLSCVYYFSGLLKIDPTWHNGQAVYIIM